MFFKNRGSGVEWLVVFLGNPGADYAGTRHNVGFMAADVVEKNAGVKINRLRFRALTAQAVLGGVKVFLIKPQTYMNLSGEAVLQAVNFYKIRPENVLVISDDISLPVGKLRVRAKGSAGGHKGLKSIIEKLGTDEFPRIKIGVGAPPHPDYEVADWVLARFEKQDADEVAKAVKRAADAVEVYIRDGEEKAMNVFNGG